jgi:hypothetical protein
MNIGSLFRCLGVYSEAAALMRKDELCGFLGGGRRPCPSSGFGMHYVSQPALLRLSTAVDLGYFPRVASLGAYAERQNEALFLSGQITLTDPFKGDLPWWLSQCARGWVVA